MKINTENKTIIAGPNKTEDIVLFPELIAPGQIDTMMADIEQHLVQRNFMGKPRPRKEALFSKPGTTGSYSYCADVPAVEATGALAALWSQKNIAAFDICLVNWYSDGNGSIARHADDEADIHGMVFSISLGSARQFNVYNSDGLQKVQLEDGMGCFFRGDVLEHAIPKTTKPVGPRLSLTFRKTR